MTNRRAYTLTTALALAGLTVGYTAGVSQEPKQGPAVVVATDLPVMVPREPEPTLVDCAPPARPRLHEAVERDYWRALAREGAFPVTRFEGREAR